MYIFPCFCFPVFLAPLPVQCPKQHTKPRAILWFIPASTLQFLHLHCFIVLYRTLLTTIVRYKFRSITYLVHLTAGFVQAEIPLLSYMPSNDPSPPAGQPAHHNHDTFDIGPSSGNAARDPNPPTVARFSPSTSAPASRSTYQVTQKSPLLVATPPQITRALSQSYPYVYLGNTVMGLLTWTSKDPWESFLMVAVFWAAVLYGETLLLYCGNVLAVLGLALGIFLQKLKNGEFGSIPHRDLSTV